MELIFSTLYLVGFDFQRPVVKWKLGWKVF